MRISSHIITEKTIIYDHNYKIENENDYNLSDMSYMKALDDYNNDIEYPRLFIIKEDNNFIVEGESYNESNSIPSSIDELFDKSNYWESNSRAYVEKRINDDEIEDNVDINKNNHKDCDNLYKNNIPDQCQSGLLEENIDIQAEDIDEKNEEQIKDDKYEILSNQNNYSNNELEIELKETQSPKTLLEEILENQGIDISAESNMIDSS